MEADREPDWVFRLTSGVAARLLPLSVLLFVAAGLAVAPFLPVHATLPPWPLLVLTVPLTLVLHEALHGLGFAAFGARPRFGFRFSGGLPYAYATCPGRLFTRGQYLVIGALPLVVIDLAALALAPTGAGVYALVAAVFNTSGAVGDLWMLGLLLQTPAGTRFADEDGTSMAAYLPADEKGYRRPVGLDPRGGEWMLAWLLGAIASVGAVLLVELELALHLNGGAGGRLRLGPVLLAEVGRSGGRTHGSAALLPLAVISLVLGGVVAAAWAAISARVRR